MRNKKILISKRWNGVSYTGNLDILQLDEVVLSIYLDRIEISAPTIDDSKVYKVSDSGCPSAIRTRAFGTGRDDTDMLVYGKFYLDQDESTEDKAVIYYEDVR